MPSFSNLRINEPEAAIIFNNCSLLLIAEELTETFRDNGVISTKFCSTGNDIINEFYELNMKTNRHIYIVPILIEIRENLSNEKINIISKSIDKWIATTNEYININILK